MNYLPSSENGGANANANFGPYNHHHHHPHNVGLHHNQMVHHVLHGQHHANHPNHHHHQLVYPNVIQLQSGSGTGTGSQSQTNQNNQNVFSNFASQSQTGTGGPVKHQFYGTIGLGVGASMGAGAGVATGTGGSVGGPSLNPNTLPRTLASLSLPTAKDQDVLRNPLLHQQTQQTTSSNFNTVSGLEHQYARLQQGQLHQNHFFGTIGASSTTSNNKKGYGSKESLNKIKRNPQNLPSLGSQYHTIGSTAASNSLRESLRIQQQLQAQQLEIQKQQKLQQNSTQQSNDESNSSKFTSLRQQQGQLRKSKYSTYVPSGSGGTEKQTDGKKSASSKTSGGKNSNYKTLAASSSTTRSESGNKKHSESLHLTPEDALRKNWDKLTEYERVEIANYQTIYFVGGADCRKIDNMDSPLNRGYDDERGDYKITLKDHIAYRFEVIEMLGKGSFGQVVKAYDHKHGQMVAVKIIRNKKRFHQQALIEVKVLQHLREQDSQDNYNVIHIRNYFYFREHLCISFELLSMNLYEFIKLNNFHGCSLGLIRRFATQILQAMCLLRKSKIIHCDLKPENVLLKQPTKSAIKVIDFGSSCYDDQKIYTYIQSRFYRSPEVILGISYSTAIDMWSLGCILAELFTGHPIFPGENEQEQLLYIMEIQGIPTEKYLSRASRRDVFFDAKNSPKLAQDSRGRKRRPSGKTLEQAIQCTDEKFLDFLERCFIWEPEMRMDPFEALQHPFILENPKFSTLTHTEKENTKNSSTTHETGKPLPPISYNSTAQAGAIGSYGKSSNYYGKK